MSCQRKTGLILIAFSFVYFVGFISVLSSLKAEVIQQIGIDLWDKLAHFAVFMPIGLFLGAGLRRPPFSWSLKKAVVIGVIVVAVFGAIDEIHQSMVPSRDPSIWDVLADVLGGCVGLLLGWGGLRGAYKRAMGLIRSRSRTT